MLPNYLSLANKLLKEPMVIVIPHLVVIQQHGNVESLTTKVVVRLVFRPCCVVARVFCTAIPAPTRTSVKQTTQVVGDNAINGCGIVVWWHVLDGTNAMVLVYLGAREGRYAMFSLSKQLDYGLVVHSWRWQQHNGMLLNIPIVPQRHRATLSTLAFRLVASN
jgi:hypothetical protein